MERTNRISLKEIDDLLQEKFKEFVDSRWNECIKNRLQTRLIINFDNGRVTSIQDQAIIVGGSVLDIYTKRVLD
jgi:hypothetical protein